METVLGEMNGGYMEQVNWSGHSKYRICLCKHMDDWWSEPDSSSSSKLDMSTSSSRSSSSVTSPSGGHQCHHRCGGFSWRSPWRGQWSRRIFLAFSCRPSKSTLHICVWFRPSWCHWIQFAEWKFYLSNDWKFLAMSRFCPSQPGSSQ